MAGTRKVEYDYKLTEKQYEDLEKQLKDDYNNPDFKIDNQTEYAKRLKDLYKLPSFTQASLSRFMGKNGYSIKNKHLVKVESDVQIRNELMEIFKNVEYGIMRVSDFSILLLLHTDDASRTKRLLKAKFAEKILSIMTDDDGNLYTITSSIFSTESIIQYFEQQLKLKTRIRCFAPKAAL